MKLSDLLEAGKRHSARDERAIQDAHDALVAVGAMCASDESGGPDMHASDAFLEAAGLSHGDIDTLLRTEIQKDYPGQDTYVWLRAVYDDYVVYEVSSNNQTELYQRSYSILDGTVTLGDAAEVIAVTDYVPVGESDRMDEAISGIVAWMRKHGGAHPHSACVAKFHNAAMCAKAKDMLTGTTKWRGGKKESAAESADTDITGDLVPLVEKAVGEDGGIKIKIIQAGQGSSGYYPADVLKRDGPKVFVAGTQMYADHPSISDESDRPERSIKDLIGTLKSDARWEERGSAGPGLYAEATVRSDVAPLIEDLAPHIGVSIRALGKAGTQEIGGKRVRTIESIDQAKSVDFVTVPGAGGRVLDLIESARGRIAPTEDDDMSAQELEEARKKITELEERETARQARDAERDQELARLREANMLRDARAIVAATLAEAALPQMSRDRLTGRLAANPPVKDGALDEAALKANVTEAAKAEVDYLASVTGGSPVRGMGGITPVAPEIPAMEESEKRITAALAEL